MPRGPKTHRIYVSHSHQVDGTTFNRLEAMLLNRKNFKFRDNSIRNTQRLPAANPKLSIARRIKESDVVIVLCRPKIGSSNFIDFELSTAQKAGIPVVGIWPPGITKVSSPARKYTKTIVDWDEERIIEAIRDPSAAPHAKPIILPADKELRTRSSPPTGVRKHQETATTAPVEKPREVIRFSGAVDVLPKPTPPTARRISWWKRAFGMGKTG